MLLAALSPRSCERQNMSTLAFLPAQYVASAEPMPVLAPLITTVLPERSAASRSGWEGGR
jgi:hypothetical protein